MAGTPEGDAKGGLRVQGGKRGSAGSPLQLHQAASLRIPAGAGSGTPGQSRGGGRGSSCRARGVGSRAGCCSQRSLHL